jgi:hypothetical protein
MREVTSSYSAERKTVTVTRRHAAPGDWLSISLTEVEGGFIISRTLAA